MLICSSCGHPCHCKGVGPYFNTNQCLTVVDCGCLNCIHEIIKERNMIKKIKDKAIHYWANHKIESIVFVVLVVALIVK